MHIKSSNQRLDTIVAQGLWIVDSYSNKNFLLRWSMQTPASQCNHCPFHSKEEILVACGESSGDHTESLVENVENVWEASLKTDQGEKL